MRLFITFLLVTLALCCYEAHATACKALVDELIGFVNSPKILFKVALKKFDAPPEAVEAKLKVKECTDNLSFGDKLRINAVVGKIVLSCAINE